MIMRYTENILQFYMSILCQLKWKRKESGRGKKTKEIITKQRQKGLS